VKVLSGIPASHIATTMGRTDGNDVIMFCACANVIKALDGVHTFRSDSTAVGSLRPAAFDAIRPWVESKRGTQVLYVSQTQYGRSIGVSFGKKGVAEFSQRGDEVARRLRIRGNLRTRESAPKHRRVAVSAQFNGAEDWVSSILKDFRAIMQPFKMEAPKRKKASRLHMLTFTMRGPRLKTIASFEDVLEQGNYTEQVVAQFDASVEQLCAKQPKGRLLLLHGPPGTGKTYMIRSMINAMKNGPKCVLVPAQYVPEMTTPSFGNLLLRQNNPTCLIIEDADMLIVKRGSDNMTAINSMLNLADGMFGQVADVRIVCSTNATKLDIEPALLRSGRLIDQIRVDNLQPSHAAQVLERLGAPRFDFKGPVSLATLYAMASGQTDLPELQPSRRAGFVN